jgi:hypothetical protein
VLPLERLPRILLTRSIYPPVVIPHNRSHRCRQSRLCVSINARGKLWELNLPQVNFKPVLDRQVETACLFRQLRLRRTTRTQHVAERETELLPINPLRGANSLAKQTLQCRTCFHSCWKKDLRLNRVWDQPMRNRLVGRAPPAYQNQPPEGTRSLIRRYVTRLP